MPFLLTKQGDKIAYMTALSENMGDRLRRAREEAQTTQQELADYVGVSRAAVAQWENGETKNVRPENLFKAAEKLGKSAKWLALGEGPETPPENMFDAISSLPRERAQQSLDFIEFQWNNADGLIASEKIASYTAMIDRIRTDLDRKKNNKGK